MPSKHAFNDVSRLVKIWRETVFLLSGLARREFRRCSEHLCSSEDTIAVVTLVTMGNAIFRYKW